MSVSRKLISVLAVTAGTSNSEFNITATLKPHHVDSAPSNQIDDSAHTASFFLDTIHKNGTVQVNSISTDSSLR